MTEPNINPSKRLYRTREGHIVAGVCTGIDPTLVRLAFAVLTIFGGAGILIYLIAWIVIPEEGGDGSSIAESFVSKRRS
jgi:phage shock protein C